MWHFYMPTQTKIECFILETPTIWKWMEIRRRLSPKNVFAEPKLFCSTKGIETADSSNNKSGICFRSIRMLAAGRTIKGNSRRKGFHNWSAFLLGITSASLTFTTIEDWIIRWWGDEDAGGGWFILQLFTQQHHFLFFSGINEEWHWTALKGFANKSMLF